MRREDIPHTIPMSRQLVSHLTNGTFELDCPQIELYSQDEDHRIRYSGPGIIKQEIGQGFIFRIFISSIKLPYTITDFTQGQIIPKEKLFQLSATDLWDDVWTCEDIFIHMDHSSNEKDAVIYGMLNSLTKRNSFTPIEGPEQVLEMRFTGAYELPIHIPESLARGNKRLIKTISKSISSAIFTSDVYNFTITQQSGYLEVRVQTKSNLNLE